MENTTITITDVHQDDFGDTWLKYTIIIPRENGRSLRYGIAKLEDEIEIPDLNE